MRKIYQVDKLPDGVSQWRMRCRKMGIEGRRFKTRKEAIQAGESVEREFHLKQMEGERRVNATDAREMFEIKSMHESLVEEFGDNNPLLPYKLKFSTVDLAEYGTKLIRTIAPFKDRGADTNIDGILQSIAADLEAKVTKAELPTFFEIADDFSMWLRSKDARKNRTHDVGEQYLENQQTDFKKLINAIGDCRLDSGRHPAITLIDDLKTKTGKPYAPTSKHKVAAVAHRLGEFLTKKGYLEKNIFHDFYRLYPMGGYKNPETYKVDQIEEIFTFLVSSPNHRHMIPFFALSVFGTFRPSDLVGGAKEPKVRHFNYSQLNGFKHQGQYDDYFVYTPEYETRENKRGEWVQHKAGKTIKRQSSLSRTGMLWIKHYHEQIKKSEVPNPDKPYWNTRLEYTAALQRPSYDDSVYNRIGLTKIKDGFRHTICSMQHALHSNMGYFTERSGHTQKTFKNHYRDATVTREEAKRFFKITPEYILEKAAAACGAGRDINAA